MRSRRSSPQEKKREELEMTVNTVDHGDAIKYNREDKEGTYGRSKIP